MGRNRAFDVDEVLDRAARAFLATGYEGTSIDDLVQATGLHRGSLYSAFGSKRGMFLAALRRRTAGTRPTRDALDLLLVATLEAAPGDREIRGVVRDAVDRLAGDDPAGVLGRRLLERARLTELTQGKHTKGPR